MNNRFKNVIVSTAALAMLTSAAAFADEAATEPILISEPTADVTVEENIAVAPAAPISTAFEVIDGITMLPLREIAEHFGYTVEWFEESQSVAITRGAQQISFSIGEDLYAFSRMAPQSLGKAPVLVNDCTTYVPMTLFTDFAGLNCYISESECTTVQPAIVSVLSIEEDGSILVADDFYGEVIVRADENTEIVANGEAVTADLIAPEQLIAVEYGAAMTRSIPPQTTATKIEILNLPVEELDEEPVVEEMPAVDVKISSIEEDGSLIVEDPVQGEVIVRIAEETKITRNGEDVTADELKEGAEISVVYANYMTMSIPPRPRQ